MLGAQRSCILGHLISLVYRRQSRDSLLTSIACRPLGPTAGNYVLSLGNFLFASCTNIICLYIRYIAFTNGCIYSDSSSFYDTEFPHATSLLAPNSAETGVAFTNGETQPYGDFFHRRLLLYTHLFCVTQCSPTSPGLPCRCARHHECLIPNNPSRSTGSIQHCARPA